MKLTWKKNIASDYSIFHDSQKIGGLRKEDLFTDKIIGKICTEEFIFYKNSIFDSSVSFKNMGDSSQIGSINFNIWNNKANIEFGSKRYIWQYNNFLNKNGLLKVRQATKLSTNQVLVMEKSTLKTMIN